MNNDNKSIFISYCRKDLAKVKTIKSELEHNSNTHYWMDLDGIESGEQFKRVIISAINNCGTVFFMLSKNSMNSDWALDELDFAKMKGKRLVIIHLEDVQMTDEFYFTYHKYDQIKWIEAPQREKLFRDIRRWIRNADVEKCKNITTALGEDFYLTPIERNGKYGFADNKGNIIIPCKWCAVNTFSEGLASVKDANGKWGFIDKTGSIVLSYKWAGAGWFKEGLAGVKDKNGKWGFIDRTGTLVLPCKWNNANYFSEGLAGVMDANGKFGFIDKTGSLVLPYEWNGAGSFNGGLANVANANNIWGYIDKAGKIVIPSKWNFADSFNNEGLAIVIDANGKEYCIDRKGNVKFKEQ